MSEGVWGKQEKARRVLQAAAVEAHGRPGVYVLRDRVMSRANVLDISEFVAVAEYLDEQGWIVEASTIPRRGPLPNLGSSHFQLLGSQIKPQIHSAHIG